MSDVAGQPPEPHGQETLERPVVTATARTDRDLWLEVVVVLSVGVVPHLMNAFVIAVHGPGGKQPCWLESVHLCVSSACISFVVLYLMSRSREPWKAFGVARLRVLDVLLGLLILLVHDVLWNIVRPALPADVFPARLFFSRPETVLDCLLITVAFAVGGFAEELVMRAYLITRLERLLKSGWLAVLVSALLFASYHMYYGPGGSLLFIGITGLVYGGFYLLLRRVWPLAIAHMLMNMLIEVLSG